MWCQIEGIVCDCTVLLQSLLSATCLSFISLLLPAHKHLQRVQGVGCHDPGSHSELHFVCENGRLRDPLSKHDTNVILHLI